MFQSTRWTMILMAAREDPKGSRPALGELCQRYWQPLHALARREGCSEHEASDLVQEFFAKLIDGSLLAHADPLRGQFRAYLATAWKRFHIDQRRYQQTLKRGGGQTHLSLGNESSAPIGMALADHREDDVDAFFERQWAQTLVADTLATLRQQYVDRKQETLFDAIVPRITQAADQGVYQQLAAQLSQSEGAIRVAMHRLRERFAQLLRQRVEETVSDASEVDAEIDLLLRRL
jgi:RNA polymerase sigma factor (sigma-70 family)